MRSIATNVINVLKTNKGASMNITFIREFIKTRTYWLLLLLPVIFIAVVILTSFMGLFYIGIANRIGFDYTFGAGVIIAVLCGGFLLISLLLIVFTLAIGIGWLAIQDWQGCFNILVALLVLALLAGEVYLLWYVGSHF